MFGLGQKKRKIYCDVIRKDLVLHVYLSIFNIYLLCYWWQSMNNEIVNLSFN